MIAAVDVHYTHGLAGIGCILFNQWDDQTPIAEHTMHLETHHEYVPGEFYKRELPCILAVLEALDDAPGCIVIDGYVWLGKEKPGLGEHLRRALAMQPSVVGVAKEPFAGNRSAETVCRGVSRKPLFVTASGMPTGDAASLVAGMHGAFRIPTLLKHVDWLSRSATTKASS